MQRYFLFLLFSIPFFVVAQNNNAPSSYDVHDIRITGYLQAQYQKAQSAGIASWSGGDFDKNADSRFMIRRGRLKIDRADDFSSIVFQLDGTQDGIRLMDAFIQFHPPALKSLRFTAGLFNRPFGYSIVYSSGYRDFPERARVFQTLMPRERDLGAMISYHPQKTFKFLTAQLALVNGSGLNAKDYDKGKDLIGNVSFNFDSLAQQKLQIGFGASCYKGTVRSHTVTLYESKTGRFIENTDAGNENRQVTRDYYGFDVQVAYTHAWGLSSVKTEYIAGRQPGQAASATVSGPAASVSFSSQPTGNLYLRHFEGYYVWLTQQIAGTKLTALLAWDVYDPNTDVEEEEIGLAGNYTTAGDIKFSTLGYGLTYALNSRLKVTAYHEQVSNKGTRLSSHSADLKDDVFTARLQYRW